METINKAKLEIRASSLNKYIGGIPGRTPYYHIDGPYNGFRLVLVDPENGSERDISPRLSKSRLYEWLWAFEDGIRLGMELQMKGKDK